MLKLHYTENVYPVVKTIKTNNCNYMMQFECYLVIFINVTCWFVSFSVTKSKIHLPLPW